MTCYMRHMGWLFDALGLPDGKRERHSVDTAIRQVLDLPDGVHCPEVWAAIKALDDTQRSELATNVAQRLATT